jgi:DNA-binding NtrC family response regulator
MVTHAAGPGPGSILIVDDDINTALFMKTILHDRGFDTEAVHSGRESLDHLRAHRTDVVIADVHMPGMSGIELCRELRDHHPDLLSIVITGDGSVDAATEAIRAGAYDFIVKPVALDALAIAVARAMEHVSLRREVLRLRAAGLGALEGILGKSRAIRRTIALVERVAESDATVLVSGESGTGKELVARALHSQSSRRDAPFVAVNCAAMPATLLESELFGHVRGAFTDAKQSRPGVFVLAGSGTLLLDEIGEMPLEMQVKLLRVLQERTVRPVGGDQERPFAARLVVSTNLNLEHEVAAKRFRRDLYYRINVIGIPVPSLRERVGDILLLAQHFLERCAERIHKPVKGISESAARVLKDYGWPGNVREVENCIERAVALCRFDEITIGDLPSRFRQRDASTASGPLSAGELVTLDEMALRHVHRVLHAVGGNKTHAARLLGVDRCSLYRRLKRPIQPRLEAPPVRLARRRHPIPNRSVRNATTLDVEHVERDRR